MTKDDELVRRGDVLRLCRENRWNTSQLLSSPPQSDAARQISLGVEALPAAPFVQQTGTPPEVLALVFNNADATPKTVKVYCSAESVPDIMAWYGAYHGGDRYTVAADGRNVPMDHNGEPIAWEARK